MPAWTWNLSAFGPYALRPALRGHGWFDLSPHAWDDQRRELRTAVALGGLACDLRIVEAEGGLRVRVRAAEPLGRERAAGLRAGLRRMLRLDVDLAEFWSVCAADESLHWVPAAKVGYLMQSPQLFEDLLKLLFTTNCSWSATRSMCRNLVAALGSQAPSGRQAFPNAELCAAQGEDFWRDEVRVGYRAGHCVSLARRFAADPGAAAGFEDPELPTPELRSRLLALPGFGPYAAGQALRGLGRYDDLALDSWCRAKMARLTGRRKPPSDRWFERRYARFGQFRGLALWMELTRDWHLPSED